MKTGWIITIVVAVLAAKAWLLHRFIKQKIAASAPLPEKKTSAMASYTPDHAAKQNDHASQ